MPTEDPAPRRPAPARRIVFVGLGLIGGSCADATRRAWPGVERVGVDREVIVDVALERGIIDRGFPQDELALALDGADLVVLALPVLTMLELIEANGELLRDVVVTDTGTTKRAVHDAARRAGLQRFIGGHPMAGDVRGGLAHADAGLFDGATWFLCPEASGDDDALRLLRTWVRELGAVPVEIEVDEHDRAVALTSHLPHLVANVLSETVLAHAALDAAGGSLREILKVAGAPFEVWWDNLTTNRPAVESALDELAERIQDLRGSLDDRERVRSLFVQGRACRERLRGLGNDREGRG
jgi:prephenate dehydrogenase